MERYRHMSAADKMRIVRQLTWATQELALAGIRQRHPNASPREVQMRLAATRLDAATLRDAFGWPDSSQNGP
ncbi:MAG TPA: hypothetical protein VML75_18215 [Kofleriaceae bacterium]|nr:hypothetical protein [Kofleriaceae bacterium]